MELQDIADGNRCMTVCLRGQSYKDLLEYFFVVRDSQVTSAADVMHVLEGRLSVSTGDNVVRNLDVFKCNVPFTGTSVLGSCVLD